MTNIPIDRLSLNQMKGFGFGLGEGDRAFFGQNEAIEQLARAIRCNKAGLNRRVRLGRLSSGSDWTGKTGIGASLWRGIFGGDDS